MFAFQLLTDADSPDDDLRACHDVINSVCQLQTIAGMAADNNFSSPSSDMHSYHGTMEIGTAVLQAVLGKIDQILRTREQGVDQSVTADQLRRFYTIASDAGWTREEWSELLTRYGLRQPGEMSRRSLYAEICSKLSDPSVHAEIRSTLTSESKRDIMGVIEKLRNSVTDGEGGKLADELGRLLSELDKKKQPAGRKRQRSGKEVPA